MPPLQRPWAMRMSWLELAFLNWRVPAEAIARTLPAGVELDTFANEAWLSVVPFRMEHVAPRLVPDLPGLSAFPELNLRTYVTVDGVPGVWFYSLDAGQPLAVRLARQLFYLPYFDARMWVSRQENIIRYASQRTHAGASAGVLAAAYQPSGEVFTAQPGTLDDWLTNRLALYSADSRGRVFRGRIAHIPWPLRRAKVVIRDNALADPLGIVLEGEPYALYAERLDVRAWLLERVR